MYLFWRQILDLFCNCHVTLGSSAFPAACHFLSFWSRNVKSFWQKQRFGLAWARKRATDFSFEETQKNTFLTHTRFQARWWWELETQSRSLAILVFSWGYTCAFPCFCEKTSQMSRFWSTNRIDVGRIFNTYAFTITFFNLCENTYEFYLFWKCKI